MGQLKEQSNPFSTGGGGVNFETRVQASFLVAFLAGTPVPCMPNSARITEVGFQSKYKGVHTDDIHIQAVDVSGQIYRLYVQIKHEITVSDAVDSTFSEVIGAAWQDFNSPDFNTSFDSIALVTGPLTKVDVTNTIPVLEWARYSSSAEEFFCKTMAEGFTSEKKIERLKKIRKQLDRANNDKALTDDEVWRFLKVFYLISYDVDQAGSVTAAMLGALVQQHSELPVSAVLAKVVTVAQDFNQCAGTLTISNVPGDLKSLFKASVNNALAEDVEKLKERSKHVYSGISNSISGTHVSRYEAVEAVRDAYEAGGFVFVTGERGAGKSGVVKDYAATVGENAAIFYVRAEDFDKSHLNDVFASSGIRSDLGQLATHFALIRDKILVIESVEKVLELNNPTAFSDLLNFISAQQDWGIIATGRDYAYQQLAFNYFQPRGIRFNSVNVTGFSSDQVAEVCASFPALKPLTENRSLVGLLSNPFCIDLAVRALGNGAEFGTSETESEFRSTIWGAVIENQSDRRGGMPARRRSTFIEIAKLRAKKMVFGVRDVDFDPEVVAKLESDNLILKEPRTSLISPAHDVLEDWALEEFIEGEYLESFGNASDFLTAIGNEPAINRGFRLWLGHKIAAGEELTDFIENVLADGVVASYWKDEVIAAILQSDAPEAYFALLKENLLCDQARLLIRFFFILRITCQRPMEGLEGIQLDDDSNDTKFLLFLRPYGKGWSTLLNFTFAHRLSFDESHYPHIVEVLDSWSEGINIWSKFPPESEAVGELCLFMLESFENSYRRESLRSKLLKVLLKVVPAIPEQFNALVEKDVFVSRRRRERPRYVDELVSLALSGDMVAMLCRHRPDFIIRLAMHEWLSPEPEGEDRIFRSMLGVADSYGLEDPRGFFPASGARGPFKYLLQHHPRKGLDFILDLCRAGAQKHGCSEYRHREQPDSDVLDEMVVEQVQLYTQDGTQVLNYASPHLWCGYRGQSTVPYLLQCALMAFESWLVEYVENPPAKNEITWIFDYVLKSSNSVLTTSVLASVAIGFPEKVGALAYPLLRCPMFYKLDMMRSLKEGGELNWFATQRDSMSRIYEEERKQATLRTWRNENLETLLTKLQLLENYRSEACKIVDELIEIAEATDDKALKFLIHRVNTREWEAIEDKENSRIIFQSKQELSEDLQQIQSEHQNKHASDAPISRLYVWSKKIFEDPKINRDAFISCAEAIKDAKDILESLIQGRVGNLEIMALGAVATAAAVAVRDYFNQLSEEDLGWCLDVIIQVIHLHSDELDGHTAVDATDSSGSGACAYVLAKLLDCELNPEQVASLHYTIVTALTHANVHVCVSAAKGVRDYLWARDEALANACLIGALEFARFELTNSYTRRTSYYGGSSAPDEWPALISKFREEVLEGKFTAEPASITSKSHSMWRFHVPMLMIPFGSSENVCAELLSRTVSIVYDDENSDRNINRSERLNHEVKKVIQDCLGDHAIATRASNFESIIDVLIEGCQKDPGFIYGVKLRFDASMEAAEDYSGIWELWSLLAPQMHEIALTDANTQYGGRQFELNMFMRGMLYADGFAPRHPMRVKALEVGAQLLIGFCERSAANSLVFESLCTLMYHSHYLFFEKGIDILARAFKENPRVLDSRENAAFCLEMSMAKYLQSSGSKISRRRYEACLDLLTGIVETGSARAYYLRESLIRTRRIAV
ncbi:hypothetical protein [Pseudomonas sp. SIMBA_067]|uniref:hypothetical protein n=1 Tax=Pseudomonas sp. SIMBA_067 TaxID=3085807 RepID=UPI00397CF18A